VKAALVHMVEESNHLTLTECRDRLAEETGVRVHPCTVSRALRRLPWT
jgi:transposase